MKIVRLLKRGNNVFVYFDEGSRIKITYEIAVKSNLRKDDELNETIINSILSEDEKYRIKMSAFRLLSRRAHSVFELRRKLLAKYDNKNIVNSILNELIEREYLDDEKFALDFTEQRLNKKKSGLNKIKAELNARGVKKEFIENAVEKLFDRDQLFEIAFELAGKKLSSLKGREKDGRKIRMKLMNFLYARGFDYEIVRSVSDKIYKEEREA